MLIQVVDSWKTRSCDPPDLNRDAANQLSEEHKKATAIDGGLTNVDPAGHDPATLPI
jgi:hypothetical protein